MCLCVKTVPTKQLGRVVPCYKWIVREWHCDCYTTPYQGKEIRTDGWLVPDCQCLANIKPGVELYGGVIHAYKRRDSNDISHSMFPAFAINVLGYGWNSLACQALYIPIANTSSSSQVDNDVIVRWSKRKRKPSVATIIKQFPFLQPYLMGSLIQRN